MNPRELALALAVTTVIADAAKERKDQLRAQLQDALDTLGADAVRAELPDGTRVARTAMVVPAATATVTDEDMFVKHVSVASPHNVQTLVLVREAYRKLLLERLVPGPDGQAVDPDTGELVPGVAFRERAPYVSTRFDKGGRDAVVDALRSGTVALDLTGEAAALPGGAA